MSSCPALCRAVDRNHCALTTWRRRWRQRCCGWRLPEATPANRDLTLAYEQLSDGDIMKAFFLCILASLAWPIHAAEPLFSKPIRMVVPFPAGSTTDSVARTLSDSVSRAIHQTIIVDNKAGADGAIAAAEA